MSDHSATRLQELSLDLFPQRPIWRFLASRWTIIASCNLAWLGFIQKWIMPVPYIFTWATQPYSSEQKAQLLMNAMSLHQVQMENIDLHQQIETLSRSSSAISQQLSNFKDENASLRDNNNYLKYQIEIAKRSPNTKQLLSGFLNKYPNLIVQNDHQQTLFGNNAVINVSTSYSVCHYSISYVNRSGDYSVTEGDLDFEHRDVLVNGIVPWKIHLIYWTSSSYCQFEISVLSR